MIEADTVGTVAEGAGPGARAEGNKLPCSCRSSVYKHVCVLRVCKKMLHNAAQQ